MVELPSLIQYARYFAHTTLLYYCVYILRVVLPRHSWGLYGELSFLLSGGAAVRPNILWLTLPF